jgi:hypothetical protein
MDSEFTRMVLAIAESKEKERLYYDAKEEFDRIFERAKKYGKLSDEYAEKEGFWNACKLMYYAWRHFKLMQKSEMLHKIAGMRLKEWQFANEKI